MKMSQGRWLGSLLLSITAALPAATAHAQLAITPATTPFVEIAGSGHQVFVATSFTWYAPNTTWFVLMSDIMNDGFTGSPLFSTTLPSTNQLIAINSNGGVLWGGDTSGGGSGHRNIGGNNQDILTMAPSNTAGDGGTGNGGKTPRPEQLIAPFWDNLYPESDPGFAPDQSVYGNYDIEWKVVNSNLIIEWKNIRCKSGAPDALDDGNDGTFEVIIYSTPNANGPFCDFVYKDTFFVADGGNDGSSASIGYRDWNNHPAITSVGAGGVDGAQYSFNGQVSATDPTPAGVAGYDDSADAQLPPDQQQHWPHALRLAGSGPIAPMGTLTISQSSGRTGDTIVATCSTIAGYSPDSTGLSVTVDATSINAGTVVLHDDGIAPDAVAGDGVFTGTITVGANATIGTAGGANGQDQHPIIATAHDAQGRSSAPSTQLFAFRGPTTDGGYVVSTTTGGTIVPGATDSGVNNWLENQSPQDMVQVVLPFTWTYYGVPQTSVYLSANGLLSFAPQPDNGRGDPGNYYNEVLPTNDFDPAMFPYWDDLYTDPPGDDNATGIFTSVTGTAPNRVFNIEYRLKFFGGGVDPNVPGQHYMANIGSANFEVRLYEGQTKFDFVYGTFDPGQPNYGQYGQPGGDGGSIGCQNIGPLEANGNPVLFTNYDISIANGSNFPAEGTVLTFDLPAPGICCRGATCSTMVSQADCTPMAGTAGALFVASSSNCNASPTSNTPCCYADYNKVGGVSVQDIFAFLADWFAGSPFANVGGDGSPASLRVQNIFDFLAAWFAGGC